MDCRTFQQHHLAFVDDTLPGADRELMEHHRRECASCERHDSLVRRGIFLARNIQRIEPSSGFADRLEIRLKSVKQDRRPVLVKWDRRFGHTSTMGTVAIGVAACALLAIGVAAWTELDAVPASSSAQVDGFANHLPNPAGSGGSVLPTSANGFSNDNSARSAATGTIGGSPAPRGYTLDMQVEPSFASYDGTRLMHDFERGIDPALVTSASVGLSLWPALMLNDDLPRVFRESGFSLADLSH